MQEDDDYDDEDRAYGDVEHDEISDISDPRDGGDNRRPWKATKLGNRRDSIHIMPPPPTRLSIDKGRGVLTTMALTGVRAEKARGRAKSARHSESFI